MFLLLIFSGIGYSSSKLSILKFNKTGYDAFINNFPRNNFLITLSIYNITQYNTYQTLFNEICQYISLCVGKKINISYSILINQNQNIKADSSFLVYLPGVSEMEVNVYPQMAASFNSNKILSECLTLIEELFNLEKVQKKQEIIRINKELKEIAKTLKSLPVDDPIRNILFNDYSSLTNELMYYIPENKQDEKRLELQLQTSSFENSISKKIKKIINKNKAESNQTKRGISPQMREEKIQKKIIKILKKIVKL